MTARTHDLAAITALSIVFLARPQQVMTLSTALAAVFANQIGGITPDIDQPTAPFWRNLPIMRLFGRFSGRILGGHRFLTHSILGLVLFGVLARLLLAFVQPIMKNVDVGLVWWAYMIGMTSHLVMDSFTKEGVPWLLPIPIKFGFPPVKALRITTGKFLEKFVYFPALLLLEGGLLFANYPTLVEIFHRYVIR